MSLKNYHPDLSNFNRVAINENWSLSVGLDRNNVPTVAFSKEGKETIFMDETSIECTLDQKSFLGNKFKIFLEQNKVFKYSFDIAERGVSQADLRDASNILQGHIADQNARSLNVA